LKHGVFFVGARAIGGLRSGRHRSLLAKITKPNGKKRRVNRVKGFASRGRGKMDSALAGGFAAYPGHAGGSGAIHPRKRLRPTRLSR
jgi:hypothetical protein